MYFVTLIGRNGCEKVFEFNDINSAKTFIKQNIYSFSMLRDSNGDVIYSACFNSDDDLSTVFSYRMWKI